MSVVPAVARAATLAVCMAAIAPAQAQTPAAQSGTAARTGPVKQLTVDEAVRLALEQNLSLRVQRINPDIQQANVDQAMTAWTPSLTGFLNYNNTDTPPDSFLSGSSDTLKTDLLNGEAGVQQLTPWGATWFAGWDARRSTSNSIYNSFNPTLRSNLSLQYVQPLLRNRTVDSQRQQLIVSRRNRDISDIDLRGTVVSTVRSVKAAYWNLKAAIANLDVQTSVARPGPADPEGQPHPRRGRHDGAHRHRRGRIRSGAERGERDRRRGHHPAGRRRAARADLRPGGGGLLVAGARPDRPAANAAGADRRRCRGPQRSRQAHRPSEREDQPPERRVEPEVLQEPDAPTGEPPGRLRDHGRRRHPVHPRAWLSAGAGPKRGDAGLLDRPERRLDLGLPGMDRRRQRHLSVGQDGGAHEPHAVAARAEPGQAADPRTSSCRSARRCATSAGR